MNGYALRLRTVGDGTFRYLWICIEVANVLSSQEHVEHLTMSTWTSGSLNETPCPLSRLQKLTLHITGLLA